MCDHVISRCVADPLSPSIADFYLGSFHMIARRHTCVTEGRSSWWQFALAVLACVSVFSCASTRAAEASRQMSALTEKAKSS